MAAHVDDGGPERSPSTPRRNRGSFAELDLDDCRAVLAAGSIGRVGWASASGQVILPVAYVYTGTAIGFRTSPYGALSELIRAVPVAFEVESLDPERIEGVSVLVQGVSHVAQQPDWSPPVWSNVVVPWAGGHRNLSIEISIKQLSGRRIRRLPAVG